MDVGLVPGVEDDGVVRAVEDAVEGDGQLDDPEVRAEVATGAGDLVDEELADLPGQGGQLGRRECLEVARTADPFQQAHRAYLLVALGSGRTRRV